MLLTCAATPGIHFQQIEATNTYKHCDSQPSQGATTPCKQVAPQPEPKQRATHNVTHHVVPKQELLASASTSYRVRESCLVAMHTFLPRRTFCNYWGAPFLKSAIELAQPRGIWLKVSCPGLACKTSWYMKPSPKMRVVWQSSGNVASNS